MSQIYSNPVTIRGSLTIKDLSLFSKSSHILVNGIRIPLNITESYWNIRGRQNIQVEQFNVENNIKVGSVMVSRLNTIPVQNLVLLDSKEAKGMVDLTFKNSIVRGDILGMKGNRASLIFLLNSTAIPINGPPTVLEGSIDFQEGVIIRDLRTLLVNEIPFEDICHSKSREFSFKEKIIEELQTNQITVHQNLEVEIANNVNLKTLSTTAIRLDQPIQLENLQLESFEADTINNEFLEDLKLNDFIAALSKEFSGQDASNSRRVKVVGNCKFLSNIFATSLSNATVNGSTVNVNNLFNFLVLKNDEEVKTGGFKTFKDLTVLNNLRTDSINEFSLDRLLNKSLSVDKTQTIEGEVFVKWLQVKHLQARLLNNIQHSEFIDKTSFNINLKSNLKVKKLTVKNVVASSSSFDVRKMLEYLEFPPRTEWLNITVDEGVVKEFGIKSYLDHLMNFAVLKNGPPMQISGSVTLTSNKIYIKSLFKDDSTVIANYQPINIQFLFLDSIKNESISPQVVIGIKQFLQPFYLKNARVQYNALFDAEMINDVNIQELNSSIYRPYDVMTGEKRFYNLQVENLQIKGLLSGIAIEKFVAFYPEFLKFTVPYLKVKNLHVFDLNTQKLAGLFYLDFLRDRLVYNSNQEQLMLSPIVFESLDVYNDTIVAYLNEVNINDVATSRSSTLQEIHGTVVALQGVQIVGPSNVVKLNELYLNDVFANSVTRSANYQTGFLRTKDLVLNKGIIVKHSIGRNVSLETLTHSTPKLQDLMSSIDEVRRHIKRLSGSAARTPGRRLYIDFDRDIQISQILESTEPQCGKCQNQQVVQPVRHNEILVRPKRREIEVRASLPSANIRVSSSPHSENEISSLEVRWNFKNDENEHFQNLSLKNSVEDVKFLESKAGDVLMILVMKNKESLNSEIVVEKIEEKLGIVEVQKIDNLNSVTKIAMVESSQNQYMITSSFDDETSNKIQRNQFVKSFIFCQNQTQFIDTQQKIPSDKYDILLPINIDQMAFLLIAEAKRKDLFIYRLNDGSKEFKFLRKITFDDGINEIVVVPSQLETSSFIVSLQNGQFCNFEWRGIESWKSTQCGFFKRISSIKPYEHLQRNHLYISNNKNDATALTLFRQGDRIH